MGRLARPRLSSFRHFLVSRNGQRLRFVRVTALPRSKIRNRAGASLLQTWILCRSVRSCRWRPLTHEVLVAKESDVTALPFGVKLVSGSLPMQPMSSTRLRYICFFFCAHLFRANQSEGSPLPAEVSEAEPRAADGERFSEGHEQDFGAMSWRAAVEIRSGRPKLVCRRNIGRRSAAGRGSSTRS